MIVPGLCSVTFRALSIDEVVALARDNDLGAIEWGADVHVPPGDAAAIDRARAASNGLVVTYGSYLFAGGTELNDEEIVTVLDTAVAIGANTIRIWSPFGLTGSDPRRASAVLGIRRAAQFAADRGLTLGLEYHGGTLTETAESTLALLDEVGAPNLFTYWQPPYWIAGRTVADDLADVRAIGERLAHLHVYEWTPTPEVQRRPLADGADRWRHVFDTVTALAPLPGFPGPRVALLEFVAADDPANFPADAATLQNMVRR